MTVHLELGLPDPWAVLRLDGTLDGEDSLVLVEQIRRELGDEAADALASYLRAVEPTLRTFGLDAFASLMLVDGDPAESVIASCAIGTAAVTGVEAFAPADLLRTVAEAGPNPDLERSTTDITLPIGSAVRSSAFRRAAEMNDEHGLAPLVEEIRYAFFLTEATVGILHFEISTIVYRDELGAMFDAIAESVRAG